APGAVAQIRPVVDAAVRDQDNILQAIARHIGPLDPWIGECDVGECLQRLPLDLAHCGPTLVWVVEKTLEPAPGAQGVRDAVTVQVNQADFRVAQTKAGRLPIVLERATVPQTVEAQWEIADESIGGNEEINAPITVGVH